MELFLEISILLAIATCMAMVMRFLHQPLIIGHILTGLIVGPLVFDFVRSTETIALLGEIGVAILLFTVGLHLSPDIIRKFGKVSFITGIVQVLFTSLAGYFVCIALGFTPLQSVYIAVALAFSSTIIIMKLISDKRELDILYAKIAIGFLLVQDLIAVLLLIGIPLFSKEVLVATDVVRFFISGAFLIGFVVIISRFFISKASQYIARSQEFLFLFAISWGIGVAALFKNFGFSLESGALIAGVTLAALPVKHEISARLIPLRDFFIVMFFIFLGSQMQFADPQTLPLALVLSLGHLEPAILSLVTLVGLITIFGCTYLVMYSEQLYRLLAPLLSMFERRDAFEPRARRAGYKVILFGCNRIGQDFLNSLKQMEKRFLVVDHDPDTVRMLTEEGIDAEYGDASDVDLLSSIDVSKTELVISTIPDTETNLLINRSVKARNSDVVIIVIAHRVGDALSHYEDGVDYVVLPHFLGGKYASDIMVKFGTDRSRYATLKSEHIKHLKVRLAAGHEHPYPSTVRL